MKNKTVTIFIVIVIIVAITFIMRFWSGDEDVWLCQNGEWVAHGKPNISKPESTCGVGNVTPKTAEEKIVDKKVAEGRNIRITNPIVTSVITSPVKITGEARGWYFEATFPVKLIDEKGNILAQGLAEAKSDWMQDAYVPFELELTFDSNGVKRGEIIFEKDNPSGLPENADSFSVPILFEK